MDDTRHDPETRQSEKRVADTQPCEDTPLEQKESGTLKNVSGVSKKETDFDKNEGDAGKKGDDVQPAPSIDELIASLNAEKDRVLRLSAEFDNYRKRSAREMADFRKFANETIIKQLLTVVDNLERAIASGASDTSKDKGCIVEGVEMTHRDILKLFESFSVRTVDALGKPFDPSFHQAVAHQESDEHPDNTVINELQKGYLLHDRLIRPSMVVVSKAPSKKE
ncbi:MAG: nucleotide exchange factor GrpE [Desulfamplus sp.]|nr:nucleotide exchange factor GrpE [Desulfamplus sp.]